MNKKTIVENHLAHVGWILLIWMLPMMCLADVNTGLSQSLQQQLESQGWQKYQAMDGSIIYRQPVPKSDAIDAPTMIQQEEKQQLGEALERRGWQADWTPDGSLVLRPQVQPSQATVTSQADVTTTRDQAALVPDLPGFEYWRIEKAEDGSLLFHPLPQSPSAGVGSMAQTTLGRCEGSLFVMDRVSLPVDQWSEANELAQQWLQASGLQGLLVGKIRKILGIYLISLVDNMAPYTLIHQLAIRASDGRVMLLE